MTEMYAGNCGNTVSQQMRSKNDDQPAVINACASALAADRSTVWLSSLLACKDKYYTSPTLAHSFTKTVYLMFMVMMQHFPKLTHHSKKAKLQVMKNESNK